MGENQIEEIRSFWNRVADDWRTQVGDSGDTNRRFNSDPVLWAFAGNVKGLSVLDAGCGTGYLSNELSDRGARVIGVDLSPRMIDLARASYPDLDFQLSSCSDLSFLDNNRVDLIVSNYVLMDTPDLLGALNEFNRVLKTGGHAVLIFSHPCFPQGKSSDLKEDDGLVYHWDFSYFEQRKNIDPPWGHFNSDFIWFHRPLSDYWKAFTSTGFQVVDFEEPRITEDRYALVENEATLKSCRIRPCSVAFKLLKSKNG